jgi:hypothetical protein
MQIKGMEEAVVVQELHTRIRPRFSRGQEGWEDTPEKHVIPNFARGQATPTTIGRRHRGEFANGQERVLHHPEDDYEGRFSRGQEVPAQAGSR